MKELNLIPMRRKLNRKSRGLDRRTAEKRFKILTKAELLNSTNRVTIARWFDECLNFMVEEEEYERAAILRDANSSWQQQFMSGSTPSMTKA